MIRYSGQSRLLMAVDCLIFGFDQGRLKLLLIQRAIDPDRRHWSLIGGFLQKQETLDNAAKRILLKMTGLQDVYMEPVSAFSDPKRDPVERTVSMAYCALININDYKNQLRNEYQARWFEIEKLPELVYDHLEMVKTSHIHLRYRASRHPILFELLPEKFTFLELLNIYESIFGKNIDKRNFFRKLSGTGLIVKQNEKDRLTSKKGSFYYQLNKEEYDLQFNSFLNIAPYTNSYVFAKQQKAELI